MTALATHTLIELRGSLRNRQGRRTDLFELRKR